MTFDFRSPFLIVAHTRIAIDYRTGIQYGGGLLELDPDTQSLRIGSIQDACFFSIGAPGQCLHFVINLPEKVQDYSNEELSRWLAENFRQAQHVRTCDVRD